ncbi:hypothetical protein GQ53DRAFT_630659 [Thozetella sp. PMI_491]|nr:hypothetical protein GQ53DRAFT_630659 [Thozetella sp. PMI_491]
MIDWLFGARRVQPPRVSTDDVVPFYLQDDTPLYRTMVLSITFRFHDVLDPDKLHGSLCQLLSTSTWRRVGGRIRKTPSGKFEIHIPRPFTRDRPAAGLTRAMFNIGIDEHVLARQLPRPQGGRPSVQPGANQFLSLAKGDATPTTLDDYLFTDAPQIWLHIASFQDATLVSISWIHATSDAQGISQLLKAWSLVLAGREKEVPPMLSFEHDAMAQIAGEGSEEDPADLGSQATSSLAHLHLVGFRAFLFIICFILDMLLLPKTKPKMIFWPKGAVAKLCDQALLELGESSDNGPFLTTGDVLTAFCARLGAWSLPLSSSKTICLINAIDLRNHVPLGLGKGVYVQNVTSKIYSFFPAQRVIHGGKENIQLGLLAGEVRASIAKQSEATQVTAMVRLEREALAATGKNPMFGDPGNFIIFFSNWTKARFLESVDFGPAVVPKVVVSQPEWPQAVELGQPAYFHALWLNPGFQPRSNVFSICEYPNGDVWVNANMPSNLWIKVEEELLKV